MYDSSSITDEKIIEVEPGRLSVQVMSSYFGVDRGVSESLFIFIKSGQTINIHIDTDIFGKRINIRRE